MSNYDFDPAERDGSGSSESRFQEYLSLFLRGKWILLGSVGVFMGIMLGVTLMTKPVYEASSMVLVNSKTQGQALPFGDLGGDGTPNKISNELGILKSGMMAEKAAQRLLQHPYLEESGKELLPIVQVMVENRMTGALAPVEAVAQRVRGSVEFTPQRESDIIRITARSRNKREAAIVANVYADVYKEENLNASRTQSTALREFLESRLGEQRSSLTLVEDSIKQFMESSGIVSLDASSSDLVQQLSQLEASRNALDIDIQTLSQRLVSYKEQLPQQEQNVSKTMGSANDPYIRLLQDQIAKLEIQRDVIIAQNDPRVLGEELYKEKLEDINSQISSLRAKLSSRSNELISSLLPAGSGATESDPLGYLKQLKQNILQSTLELESMAAKRVALDRILRELEDRFGRIPRQSIKFAKLQRSRMSTEKLYLLVEEKYNEASIKEKSEFGYVDIIDRATIPGRPQSPDMRRNLLMGLLMGLVVGVGVVFLLDLLDIRVRTPEGLRRRGYLTLTEVAPMEEELRKLRGTHKFPQGVKWLDEHLALIFNPMSFMAESYRRLRTTILHFQLSKPMQVMLVTSPNAGEGKSVTVSNLAISFAETQKRVLLLDVDLRRPTIHSSFGLVPQPGLTELLQGKVSFEDVVRRDVVENLDVICCGGMIRNPSKVLASDAMKQLLKEARKTYAMIFIDTPPVLIVNEAAVLAGLVDGVVLVVTSGTTRFATLDRATEFLRNAGGTILGVVLNKYDPKKTYGRFYGTHRYGHYGPDYNYYSSNGKGSKRTAHST